MKKIISSRKGLTTDFITILFIVITIIIIISLVAVFASRGSSAGKGFIDVLKGIFGGS